MGGIYILAKSKLKNITLSLMAIHAEMRDMAERQKLQAIIESLKKLTEAMKWLTIRSANARSVR